MLQPEASKIALWTAGRFFADGEAYDPDRALDEALEVVAGSRAGGRVLARLADQFRSHPFIGDEAESRALTERAEAFFATRSEADEQALRALLQSFVAIEADLAREVENPRLVAELGEPARKLSLYGTAGLLGLDALAAQARGEPVDDGAICARRCARPPRSRGWSAPTVTSDPDWTSSSAAARPYSPTPSATSSRASFSADGIDDLRARARTRNRARNRAIWFADCDLRVRAHRFAEHDAVAFMVRRPPA